MTTCTNCGNPLRPGANFCPLCQAAQPMGSIQNPPVPTAGTGRALARTLLLDPQGNQFPVVDQMTLGRDPTNTVHLDQGQVSRQHARIIWQITHWVIMDLGSANGTFVNGNQVNGSAPLAHGDRLAFGPVVELMFGDPTMAAQTTGQGVSLPTQRVSQPIQPAGIPGMPSAPAPQLNNWGNRPPQAEGFVLSVQGPITVERDGKVGKAILSVALGLISPALAFIPFAAGKNQIVITNLRIERYPADPSWPQASVTMVGDPTSILERGDLVAAWGKDQDGTIYATQVFNYTTQALTEFGKK